MLMVEKTIIITCSSSYWVDKNNIAIMHLRKKFRLNIYTFNPYKFSYHWPLVIVYNLP